MRFDKDTGRCGSVKNKAKGGSLFVCNEERHKKQPRTEIVALNEIPGDCMLLCICRGIQF